MLAHALLPEDYDLVPMIVFGFAIFSVLLALSGWTKTAIWLGSALAVVTLLVACLQIGVTGFIWELLWHLTLIVIALSGVALATRRKPKNG